MAEALFYERWADDEVLLTHCYEEGELHLRKGRQGPRVWSSTIRYQRPWYFLFGALVVVLYLVGLGGQPVMHWLKVSPLVTYAVNGMLAAGVALTLLASIFRWIRHHGPVYIRVDTAQTDNHEADDALRYAANRDRIFLGRATPLAGKRVWLRSTRGLEHIATLAASNSFQISSVQRWVWMMKGAPKLRISPKSLKGEGISRAFDATDPKTKRVWFRILHLHDGTSQLVAESPESRQFTPNQLAALLIAMGR